MWYQEHSLLHATHVQVALNTGKTLSGRKCHWGSLGTPSSKGSKVPSPQRRWHSGRSCLPESDLFLAHLFFLTAHWRCCSWSAGDTFSAFKGTLGWLFVNAQHSFLIATFLLSLLTLSLGSLGHPLTLQGKSICLTLLLRRPSLIYICPCSVLPISPFQPRAAGQAPSRVLIENLCMKAVNQSIGNSSFLGEAGGYEM